MAEKVEEQRGVDIEAWKRVNHPSHYTFGQYEVFDVLQDWFPADPLLWQAVKYLARAGRKGPALEDLQKAGWYLARRIKQEQTLAADEENKKTGVPF
jgi:hypothetical protein